MSSNTFCAWTPEGRLFLWLCSERRCARLQLEAAGDLGIVINQVMVIAVVINSIQHGMPELGVAGEFEIVGFSDFCAPHTFLVPFSFCMVTAAASLRSFCSLLLILH